MKQPHIGRKIAQLRHDKNLTQEDLAEASHVSIRTIQRLESGHGTPRSSTIRILLDALDYDFESLKTLKTERVEGVITFPNISIQDRNKPQVERILNVAWMAGILYFVSGIVEAGMEYSFWSPETVSSSWKVYYSIVKLIIIGSVTAFMGGFVVVGRLCGDYLLRIASVILMMTLIAILLTDIFAIWWITDERLKIFLQGAKSLTGGAASIILGIALLRLRDSLGKLAYYSGWSEITVGVCFVSVILFPLALVLLILSTILEIILLYKSHNALVEMNS